MKIFLLFESRDDWIEKHRSLLNNKVLARFLADQNEISTITSILRELNYEIELLDYHKLSTEQILTIVKKCDNALYWNLTDGIDYFIGSHLPSFLHLIKKPYIGSSTFVQAICQDKHLLKKTIEDHHIPTPRWVLISSRFGIDLHPIERLSPPLFVKPAKYDNSIGTEFISPLCESTNDAVHKVMTLINKGIEDVLVEEAVLGVEITVACIHTDTWKFIPLKQNYDGHYISSYAKEHEAGHLRSQSFYKDKTLIQLAKQVIKIVGLQDYCRMDFRYDNNGTPHLLEVNSGTFLTSISFTNVSKLMFKSQHDMFNQLIKYSVERQRKLHRSNLLKSNSTVKDLYQESVNLNQKS